jgi:hypothetical protein
VSHCGSLEVLPLLDRSRAIRAESTQSSSFLTHRRPYGAVTVTVCETGGIVNVWSCVTVEPC